MSDGVGTVPGVGALHATALAGFGRRVDALGDDDWHLPTPCTGWDVRELVAHVVDENRWAPPLLAGRTIADVGDELADDPLGADPVGAWRASAEEAATAVAGAGALDADVSLSFGVVPASEYVMQLTADLLVHAWDLARAGGGDEALDADVVAAVGDWFDEREALYRAAGAIGSAAAVPDGAGAQDRLLARFGRDPSPDTTLAVVRRFNDGLGRGDLDALRALVTDDCRFEDTAPPDGTAADGAEAVLAAWASFFASSPRPHFVVEEGVVAGDRATYRWRYDWDGGHVRGVDVMRVRDGRVAEKLSYVKG